MIMCKVDRVDVITINNGGFGDRMSEFKEEIANPCKLSHCICNTLISRFSIDLDIVGCLLEDQKTKLEPMYPNSSVECLDSRANQRQSKSSSP